MLLEQTEASVTEWYKRIVRLVRYLTKPEQRELADTVKAKLETFKGYLPLILCVCNPGMRARHWQQLAEISKIKVVPANNPALSTLLKVRCHSGLTLTSVTSVTEFERREVVVPAGFAVAGMRLESLDLDWMCVCRTAWWRTLSSCRRSATARRASTA